MAEARTQNLGTAQPGPQPAGDSSESGHALRDGARNSEAVSEADSGQMILELRPAVPADINFIYSTFLRGLYFGNDLYSQIDQDSYFDAYSKVLTNLLTKPGTETTVAHLPGEPDVMVGFSISSGTVLHYVFVKAAFRKQGVATQLVRPDTKVVTHITKPGNAIRKKRGWAFNPFLL